MLYTLYSILYTLYSILYTLYIVTKTPNGSKLMSDNGLFGYGHNSMMICKLVPICTTFILTIVGHRCTILFSKWLVVVTLTNSIQPHIFPDLLSSLSLANAYWPLREKAEPWPEGHKNVHLVNYLVPISETGMFPLKM